ncbi:MAG: T9SS type A sorting domain-containing protein [Fibrobacteres bacterium]|nr:T9SS type A sorting domain-containing protein [Fibrobacterota bacterium]
MAVSGKDFFTNMADNKWIEIPVETGVITFDSGRFYQTPPGYNGHVNITIDFKNRKILQYGNDIHGWRWDESNFNVMRIFDMENLQWDVSHMPDTITDFTFKDLGIKNGISYWVPISKNGHPVPAHTFDGVRYIPGTDYCMLTYNALHTYYSFFQSAADSAFLTSSHSVVEQQSCWLYNTVTKKWSDLNVLEQEPPNTFSSTTVWDSRRERLISLSLDMGCGLTPYTYDLSTKRWSVIPDAPRFGLGLWDFSGEYDPVQDRIYVYGTWSNGVFFEIDPETFAFRRLDTLSMLQPPRSSAYTSYDTLNHCMLLAAAENQTWAYSSLTQEWNNLNIPLPAQISSVGMAMSMDYDPVTNIHFILGCPGSQARLWALKYRPIQTKHENKMQKNNLKLSVNNLSTQYVKFIIANADEIVNSKVKIYNPQGRLIKEIILERDGSGIWNLSKTSNGIYIARCKINNIEIVRLFPVMK